MTEFKHGEMVCNAGELFYVRIGSEGEQTFQPLRKGQHVHYSTRRTFPVLQAAQESLVSISKFPDGTLFTMKKGYLVKHGSCMLGVWPRTSEDSEPEKFGTEALNATAILDILYPPIPGEGASTPITERLVYLLSSECWGLVDEAGCNVMELTPEKETWPLRHRDYKTYQQVLDYAPEVSYRLFRMLPLGTKVKDPKTCTLIHEDTGFTFNGERLAPNISGEWKCYFQEVVELPAEYSLPSYEAVSPEDLLWSKTLKGWVKKPYPGTYAVSLATGSGFLTDNGQAKPFSKIGKLDKGSKDAKKLSKLPKGTLITDGSCNTWECKDEGFVFDNDLRLSKEPFYAFDKCVIEIPKSQSKG